MQYFSTLKELIDNINRAQLDLGPQLPHNHPIQITARARSAKGFSDIMLDRLSLGNSNGPIEFFSDSFVASLVKAPATPILKVKVVDVVNTNVTNTEIRTNDVSKKTWWVSTEAKIGIFISLCVFGLWVCEEFWPFLSKFL